MQKIKRSMIIKEYYRGEWQKAREKEGRKMHGLNWFPVLWAICSKPKQFLRPVFSFQLSSFLGAQWKQVTRCKNCSGSCSLHLAASFWRIPQELSLIYSRFLGSIRCTIQEEENCTTWITAFSGQGPLLTATIKKNNAAHWLEKLAIRQTQVYVKIFWI